MHRRDLPGCDDRDGVLADVAVETGSVGARAWRHDHFEEAHLSRSGRWFRGLVPKAVADALTASTAREVLEQLAWSWAGGSSFDGKVRRGSGKLAS
jgi:hypothetical protein